MVNGNCGTTEEELQTRQRGEKKLGYPAELKTHGSVDKQ